MPLSYCGKADGNGCKLLAHQLNAYIIDIADDIVYDYSHKAKEERRSYTLLMTTDKMFAALLKSWGYLTDKAIPPASYVTVMVNRKDDPSAITTKDFSVIVKYASEKGKPAMPVGICTNGECDMDTYLSNMQKALVNTKNITADCTH